MKTVVCTDSSALVSEDAAARAGLVVVPARVTLDGQPFDERDVDGFYERLEAGAPATTSQPSPGDFLRAYVDAAERGAGHVLSIHLDERVSGTCESARLASDQAPIPVTVVDTKTVSYGVGVCARSAATRLAEGASVADVVRSVRGLGRALESVFVAPGAATGRVSSRSWSVLTFAAGSAVLLDPAASRDEAVDLMSARVAEATSDVRVAVGHAAAATEELADELARRLRALGQVVDVERYRVGPAVGAHTGPLGCGAFWWPAGH